MYWYQCNIIRIQSFTQNRTKKNCLVVKLIENKCKCKSMFFHITDCLAYYFVVRKANNRITCVLPSILGTLIVAKFKTSDLTLKIQYSIIGYDTSNLTRKWASNAGQSKHFRSQSYQTIILLVFRFSMLSLSVYNVRKQLYLI